MKKIWSYLAVGFAFFSAGLLAMYKIMGEQVKVTVRKVKQKRTSGNSSVVVPIEVETPEKRLKKGRKKQRKSKGVDSKRNK
ncbi:hypothetical protein KAU11_07520 [Candidatus Babeliales bacterium]|nr:hypothetical protein [Candidatus Babeliales bacterium]